MITGQHADGRRFEQKLTKRTKKVRIDQKDLVQLDLADPLETATLDVLATSGTLKSLRIPRELALPFDREEIVRV